MDTPHGGDRFRRWSTHQGKRVEEFERAFAEKVGARFAVCVSSGTAALHVAYLALIKPGDEVLVPTFTHISTASMVHYAGGTPVFCDICPRTFTIDVEEIKRKISKKTAAIAPVHLFGNSCRIDEIIDIASEYNLKIVWDAAQAHSTQYFGKDVGSFDDVVCYSFYPTKNMITGEGGIITTNSEEIYQNCKLLRSHGQGKKYYHTQFGLNYRMTEVEAVIGIEQLKKLDFFIERRRKNAEYITTRLSGIEGILLPFVEEGILHSFHQYCILLDLAAFKCSRDEFLQALMQEGVETGVHYPRPVHKQPVFEHLLGDISLPVSEDVSKRIFSLPVHPYLSGEDLERIVKGVEKLLWKIICRLKR